MALKPGTFLGPFEILSLIGAGGMGEVYKARDTRLNRFVAIKTLPAHLADRPELRERFKREATTLANLKHAHICVLYDIGHQDGIDFLVMEYLEGETLAERLKKGALPLDQVLRYADELADALDKAHRSDFTHRDIKPANIMLTKEGSKLLDFGLAKLKQEIADAITPPSERPTAPGTLTQQGTLLGTLQYMAPEQVEGKTDDIDGRSDIFGFGAVVYEMVTGKKAFEGKTQASVIAAILKGEPPPMSSLQPIVPPTLERVIKRCLAKEQDERWQTAFDLWHAVKWISQDTAQPAPPQPAVPATVAPQPERASRRQVVLWSVVFLAVAALASLATWTLKPTPAKTTDRLVVSLAPDERLRLVNLNQQAVAISPDGKNIVYVASRGGIQQLYLRSLDSFDARPMPGTETASSPFFSPDGQWVGFVATGKLQKVSINGGTPVTIYSAIGNTGLYGATWGTDDNIVYTGQLAGPLMRVPAAGGTPQPLTVVDSQKGEITHRWPEFLPGGEAVLFTSAGAFAVANSEQLEVYSLKTGKRRSLNQAGLRPRYAPTGHLLYGQGGTLMALPFDLARLEATGSPIPVAEGIMQSAFSGAAQYSFSDNGTLVYISGSVQSDQRILVWVNRNGTEQPLGSPAHPYRNPRISPDGRRVAVTIEGGNATWVYDLARDALTRLTFGEGGGVNPAWVPDGKRVAFQSGAPTNLFWQPADGSGKPERLTTNRFGQILGSWSPDGQVLAFYEINPTTSRDLWVLRLSDPSSREAGSGQGRKAQVFLKTPFSEATPVFSPDGRWLAYVSDESGRYEVYVQPYPGPGGKWQISTEGGTEPAWNHNGREIFYRSGNKMMAVDITTQPTFSPGKPRMLFEGPYLLTPAFNTNYDVSPDGQQFLMVKGSDQAAAPTQINVVLNWFEELKRKVPVQ